MTLKSKISSIPKTPTLSSQASEISLSFSQTVFMFISNLVTLTDIIVICSDSHRIHKNTEKILIAIDWWIQWMFLAEIIVKVILIKANCVY